MPAINCPACGTANGVNSDKYGKSAQCWKCKTELFPHLDGKPATKQPKGVTPYSPKSGVEDTKAMMVWWKKTLYIFFLIVFLAIGGNAWNSNILDIPIILSVLITIISVIAINILWAKIRGK